MAGLPSELATASFDRIVELAGHDDFHIRGQAEAELSKRQTEATAQLSKSIFNSQKHISQRLDALNAHLESASLQSERLGKRTLWLTGALVFATFVLAAVTWWPGH